MAIANLLLRFRTSAIMGQENFCELETQPFSNSPLYQYFKKKQKKQEREKQSVKELQCLSHLTAKYWLVYNPPPFFFFLKRMIPLVCRYEPGVLQSYSKAGEFLLDLVVVVVAGGLG